MVRANDPQLVIREVVPGLVTFSRPFARFGLFPVGGRSTAVKLSDGGVWVLASTPLDQATKETIDTLGPVKWIIGADMVHHLYLSEFKKEYPEAKVIAVHSAFDRLIDKDLKFDGAWGKDPEDTKYGFEDDVEHVYFSGFKNKDVAFLHKPSKTLIEADLLFNFPPKEQYSKTKTSLWLTSWLGPSVTKSAVKSLGSGDVQATRKDAAKVAAWDFDRIIPCHGDVIETGGNKVWRDTYEYFLN